MKRIIKTIWILLLCSAILLAITLTSNKLTYEQWHSVLIALAIDVAILFVGTILLVTGVFKKTPLHEDYVSRVESKSGISWRLPRKLNWHTETFPESREFLEKLGFIILGLEDNMMFVVEPPLGWTIIRWDKDTSGRYSIVSDQKGVEQFKTFCSDNGDRARIVFKD